MVNGPGSFTGTRLGVTVGKTISYCLDIPIKSISSIELIAINIDNETYYSVSIPDQKGYYVGEFDNKRLLKELFYLDKNQYEDYQKSHTIINDVKIDWNNIYKYNCLKEEDYYNFKPLYIKKIEVEK